jgi:cytochrome bd-type quinol oxidase subunit 2
VAEPPTPSRRRIALALFVLAWVWLSLRPSAPLQEDTSRDLAFARDLVDGTTLHLHGAWASFAALQHGSGWIDFLAACQLAGLGIVGIERLLTTLLATSVALAYLGFTLTLPGPSAQSDPRVVERASLVGALVLLASLPFVCEMPILWPPTLLPVVVVVAHLSMWRLLRDGALVDALALAFACALAFDLQLVCGALALLGIVAVALASKRPWIATPLALALGLGTAALCSPAALSANLHILDERGWSLPALLVLCAAVVAGVLARRRFGSLAWEARLRVALGVELILLATILLAPRLLPPDIAPTVTGRYVLPFVPAVALAAAFASGRTRAQRLALVLVLALLLVLASFGTLRPKPERSLPIYPEWRLAEFAPVAEVIAERGHGWTELTVRLQGPSYETVLGYLSSVVEPGSPQPARADAGLLLLALDPDDARSLEDELPAARVQTVELDDLHALLIETPARTDRRGAQLCRDGQACEDVVLAVTRRTYQAQANAWVGVEPAAQWLRADGRGEPREIQWRIPVAAGDRAVLMLSSVLPERCAWFFVASEGFASSTALPSHILELPADARGSILISRRTEPDEHACREHGVLPPAIIETDPDWVRLRELLAPPW